MHPRFRRGKPQQEVLWALERTRELLVSDPEGYLPREVANLSNALCTLTYTWDIKQPPHVTLIKGLGEWVAKRGVTNFNPQEIATFVNGFARLGLSPGHQVLNMVSRECVLRGLAGFDPQNIANVMNAFAKLDVDPGEALLGLVAQVCVQRRLEGFAPQAIANIAHGFGALRFYPGNELLKLIMSTDLEAGYTAQGLSTLLHGLAILRAHPTDGWMASLYYRCQALGWHTFTAQGLSMMLWAAVALGKGVPDCLLSALVSQLSALARGIEDQDGRTDVQGAVRSCTATRQAVFILSSTAHEEGPLEQLRRVSEELWSLVKAHAPSTTTSLLQERVGKELSSRGYQVQDGVWLGQHDCEGLLSLDLVLSLPCGAKVGVEVEGPVHFFTNLPDAHTGECGIKWAMLNRAVELGWMDAWVSVRHARADEMEKVDEAVQALRPQDSN